MTHDAAAPLVRRLADTLELIREGIFCPDEPRLQRWHGTSDFESAVLLLRRSEEAKRPRKNVPAQVSRLLKGSSSDSESSEVLDEDSDSAGSEADGHLADMHALGEAIASDASDGFLYYKHSSRQTVHRAQRPHDDDCLCVRSLSHGSARGARCAAQCDFKSLPFVFQVTRALPWCSSGVFMDFIL